MSGWRERLPLHAACVGSGLAVCFSLPPWGFWPLSFVGLIGLERLIAERPFRSRLGRTFVFCLGWFGPSMVWMKDLTLPGYVIAFASYSVMVGFGIALAPANRWRYLTIPSGLVLAEVVRWHWPFGGVPLSNLAVAQVSGPLAPWLRVGGQLGLVWLTALAAMALAAAIRRDVPVAAGLGAVVVVAVGAGMVAPHGHAVDDVTIAAVQGGGPQGTRAVDTDPVVVFDRHMQASQRVPDGVDLVLWPEDVVDVMDLSRSVENLELGRLARQVNAPVIVGIVEDEGDDQFHNAAVVYDRTGTIVDRYEKVERVPFGEWVPMRSLLAKVAGGALPERDAVIGRGPAVVHTPAGTFGVSISWEIFFPARGREGVKDGGQVLLNPTNGSSFTGTLVQTQQVANSRIRAIENGRWVVQAAPTGFSAFVAPDGRVVDRTAVSEQAVLTRTISKRTGETLATRLGDWPTGWFCLLTLAAAWFFTRRHERVNRAGPA